MIFVSGPTASGKTTFTDRLATSLSIGGRPSLRISLDDYYSVSEIKYDSLGRPDYERIHTIDTKLASQNMLNLLENKEVMIPSFDFISRTRSFPEKNNVQLSKGGCVIVEGLHGVSSEITGILPKEKYISIFIMPWGEIVSDRRLLNPVDIRLLRRIVRDSYNRGAHALATIDYWPMVVESEKEYLNEYLFKADFFVNSFLDYETMVIAPVAHKAIKDFIIKYETDTLPPSIFMKDSHPQKLYANLQEAVKTAKFLVGILSKIPQTKSSRVPEKSILNEFLS